MGPLVPNSFLKPLPRTFPYKICRVKNKSFEVPPPDISLTRFAKNSFWKSLPRIFPFQILKEIRSPSHGLSLTKFAIKNNCWKSLPWNFPCKIFQGQNSRFEVLALDLSSQDLPKYDCVLKFLPRILMDFVPLKKLTSRCLLTKSSLKKTGV